MNIETAKIAIDKMTYFLSEHILNDLYKDHNATANIISKDDNKVIFSVIFNDGEKRILTVTVKRHEINVQYSGTMQVFSQLISIEFFNDVLNVLFPEELKMDKVYKMTQFEQYLHIMSLSKNYMQLSKPELKNELKSLNENLKTFQILGHFEAFNMTLDNIRAIKILLNGVSYTFITHKVLVDMYTETLNNWNYRKFNKLKNA